MKETILSRLFCWKQEASQCLAQVYKKGGRWTSFTVGEFLERTFALALYLESEGLNKEEVTILLGYNSPFWVQADLAPLFLKAYSAGLYPNASLQDMRFILKDTQAKFLFVENQSYFEKLFPNTTEQDLIPSHIQKVIVFEGRSDFHPKAISLEEAIEKGKMLSKEKSIQTYLEQLDPKAGAFLIYTSGTTGTPKGALLSQDNLVFASDLAISHWKIPPGGAMFSFLPLCHIAEKLQNIGVGISGKYTVHFASAFENVASELQEVQPTVFLAVPRLWEKMKEAVESKIALAPPLKQKMARWAFSVGRKVKEAELSGKPISWWQSVQFRLANELVLQKIRKALGFEKSPLCASGAAALHSEVVKWFWGLGMEIYEDYGQTETAGVVTMTLPGRDSTGSVGVPLPGAEFRFASDGEILIRGRQVFLGYFKKPEETKEVLEPSGWLHTGDLGKLDLRGFVCIRGRKKEILKTSGGKMIAPLPIEEKLKAHPMISQACIVGDGRKYLVALVTLTPEVLGKVKVQQKNGLIRDPQVLSQVQEAFSLVNQHLASYEQIKYFKVLGKEFSIENKELTPTLKMKRSVIESRYQQVIDSMYS